MVIFGTFSKFRNTHSQLRLIRTKNTRIYFELGSFYLRKVLTEGVNGVCARCVKIQTSNCTVMS